MAAELQIHHSRFRILGVIPRLGADAGDSYYARNAAAVINEDPIARFHFANGADCLRILDAIPRGALVAFEIIDGIDFGFALSKKISHRRKYKLETCPNSPMWLCISKRCASVFSGGSSLGRKFAVRSCCDRSLRRFRRPRGSELPTCGASANRSPSDSRPACGWCST